MFVLLLSSLLFLSRGGRGKGERGRGGFHPRRTRGGGGDLGCKIQIFFEPVASKRRRSPDPQEEKDSKEKREEKGKEGKEASRLSFAILSSLFFFTFAFYRLLSRSLVNS